MGRVPWGTRSPYGHSRNAALRQEDSPVGRVPWGTRSPYGHSQKRLTPMAWCRHFSYACARASTAPGVGIRWDALCAFPLRALVECGTLRGEEGSPVGRAERVPPTGMSTTICLRGRGSPVGRVPQGTRSPYGHSQKRLTPMAWCRHFSYARARASTAPGIRKTPALLRSEALFLVGAGGRTRTDTDFTPQDFESSASANFTTPAHLQLYHAAQFLSSTLYYSAPV